MRAPRVGHSRFDLEEQAWVYTTSPGPLASSRTENLLRAAVWGGRAIKHGTIPFVSVGAETILDYFRSTKRRRTGEVIVEEKKESFVKAAAPVKSKAVMVNRNYKKKAKTRPKRRMSRKRRGVKRSRGLSVPQLRKITNAVSRHIKKRAVTSQVQDYRDIIPGQIASNVNAKGIECIDFVDRTFFNMVMDKTHPIILPGTTQSIKYSDMREKKGSKLLTTFGKLNFTCRNNYEYPVTVDLCWMKCKDHTSTGPDGELEAMLNHYTYDSITETSITNQKTEFLYDLKDLSYLGTKDRKWALSKRGVFTLKPAEEISVNFFIPKQSYDIARVVDLASLSYIKGLSHCLMIRTWGHIAHGDDTLNPGQGSNVGISDTKLDYIYSRHWRYKFSGGMNVHRSDKGSSILDTISNPEMAIDAVDIVDDVN